MKNGLLLIFASGLMINSLHALDAAKDIQDPDTKITFRFSSKEGGVYEVLPDGTAFAITGVPKDVRDPKTGIIFRVDPDGHYISAIRPNGKILWKFDCYPTISGKSPIWIKPLKLFFEEGAFIHDLDICDTKLETDWKYPSIGRSNDFIAVTFRRVFVPKYDTVSEDESGVIRKSTREYIPLEVNFPAGRTSHIIQDPKSKIIFYLDPDGHHLSAIRPNGKVLWKIDSDPEHSPAGDSAMPIPLDRHSRSGTQIIAIGFYLVPKRKSASLLSDYNKREEDFIGVSFSTHEFGAINKLTGEYIDFPFD